MANGEKNKPSGRTKKDNAAVLAGASPKAVRQTKRKMKTAVAKDPSSRAGYFKKGGSTKKSKK